MTQKQTSMSNLIPQPVEVINTPDFFSLTASTKIYIRPGNMILQEIGHTLAQQFLLMTGFDYEIVETTNKPQAGNILLSLNEEKIDSGDEGYELAITAELIHLSACKPAGLFYAIQTLRQLLPAKIENQSDAVCLPTGIIKDYPRYAYRGVMLDVSRHFFGVADVKRTIDLLAGYKINRLHLHLSDDQGWRIEIKSWPNLTTHGGSTQVGGGPGGFYTQEEYADIVNYAQDHFISIVPEIDLPGHTNAALASYPELNNDEQAPALYTGTQVGFSSLSAEKEVTFQFIDDVIRELAAITPGAYIHIGGDEAQSTSPSDYAVFIRRIQDIVKKHGKQMIGWDEILKTDLMPGSVAQYWRFNQDDFKHQENVRLIISPANKIYIDMKYNDETPLGLTWAGTVNVKDAYMWDPATVVSGISEADILGVEAPLWSETVETMADIEFMIFPRLPGIAEIGWSPQTEKDWENYRSRLAAHGPRLDASGVNFYRSPLIPWEA